MKLSKQIKENRSTLKLSFTHGTLRFAINVEIGYTIIIVVIIIIIIIIIQFKNPHFCDVFHIITG